MGGWESLIGQDIQRTVVNSVLLRHLDILLFNDDYLPIFTDLHSPNIFFLGGGGNYLPAFTDLPLTNSSVIISSFFPTYIRLTYFRIITSPFIPISTPPT